jgi:hypothetical protein
VCGLFSWGEGELDMSKPKHDIRFKLIASFGGKVLGQYRLFQNAMRAAHRNSYRQPVDVWTVSGGAFGLGEPRYHVNEGQETFLKTGDN